MSCRKWQFLLATAEACELVDNVALRDHLACCPECRQYAGEMQALSRATRSLSRLTPSSEFARKVRERLGETTEAVALPLPRTLADRWSEPGAMAQPQVAAMALLALLALLLAYYQLVL